MRIDLRTVDSDRAAPVETRLGRLFGARERCRLGHGSLLDGTGRRRLSPDRFRDRAPISPRVFKMDFTLSLYL